MPEASPIMSVKPDTVNTELESTTTDSSNSCGVQVFCSRSSAGIEQR